MSAGPFQIFSNTYVNSDHPGRFMLVPDDSGWPDTVIPSGGEFLVGEWFAADWWMNEADADELSDIGGTWTRSKTQIRNDHQASAACGGPVGGGGFITAKLFFVVAEAQDIRVTVSINAGVHDVSSQPAFCSALLHRNKQNRSRDQGGGSLEGFSVAVTTDAGAPDCTMDAKSANETWSIGPGFIYEIAMRARWADFHDGNADGYYDLSIEYDV